MGPPIFTIPITVRGALPTPRVLPDLDELKKLASSLSLRRLPGRLLGDVNRRLRSLAGLDRKSAAAIAATSSVAPAATGGPKPGKRSKRRRRKGKTKPAG